MATAFFALGRRTSHGCRLVRLVDAQDHRLHIHPVCTVNVDLLQPIPVKIEHVGKDDFLASFEEANAEVRHGGPDAPN